jgi:pimeloyl-ACP methyl ester carboxylesterase
MIARYAAAKIPDRMSALILTGTEIPHHHPKLITRLQLAGRLPGSVAITRWLVNSPRLARSNHLLGGLFHDRNLIEGDFRVNVLDGLADHAGVKRQMELLATYRPALVDGLEAIHAEITCPTLLIWGAQDAFFPLSKARAMADQFGGPTRFETIERARLLPHEEHPERFARLCAEFLTANATV